MSLFIISYCTVVQILNTETAECSLNSTDNAKSIILDNFSNFKAQQNVWLFIAFNGFVPQYCENCQPSRRDQ